MIPVKTAGCTIRFCKSWQQEVERNDPHWHYIKQISPLLGLYPANTENDKP